MQRIVSLTLAALLLGLVSAPDAHAALTIINAGLFGSTVIAGPDSKQQRDSQSGNVSAAACLSLHRRESGRDDVGRAYPAVDASAERGDSTRWTPLPPPQGTPQSRIL